MKNEITIKTSLLAETLKAFALLKSQDDKITLEVTQEPYISFYDINNNCIKLECENKTIGCPCCLTIPLTWLTRLINNINCEVIKIYITPKDEVTYDCKIESELLTVGFITKSTSEECKFIDLSAQKVLYEDLNPSILKEIEVSFMCTDKLTLNPLSCSLLSVGKDALRILGVSQPCMFTHLKGSQTQYDCNILISPFIFKILEQLIKINPSIKIIEGTFCYYFKGENFIFKVPMHSQPYPLAMVESFIRELDKRPREILAVNIKNLLIALESISSIINAKDYKIFLDIGKKLIIYNRDVYKLESEIALEAPSVENNIAVNLTSLLNIIKVCDDSTIIRIFEGVKNFLITFDIKSKNQQFILSTLSIERENHEK